MLPFATRFMNMEDITLSEISQLQKDKYYMISHTNRIFKKKVSLIHRDRQQNGDYQGQEREKGISQRIQSCRYVGQTSLQLGSFKHNLPNPEIQFTTTGLWLILYCIRDFCFPATKTKRVASYVR